MLYAPENLLSKRLYEWLEKASVVSPAMEFPREKLLELVIASGHSREAGFAALKHLEVVVNIASFWDSEKRTVMFSFIPMTPTEKLKHIEDDLWFESLPG